LFVIVCSVLQGQSFDLDKIGKEKFFRYNGGISANSVFYEGTANRQSLTYFLNGNLNLNIAGLYNIPLSFTYSNQDFDFPSPFQFNRLSLHPSYKWITAHIGDVNMSFSPYTLNGHQFTGAGVELRPTDKLELSAMYGRLLRATEYDLEEPRAIASYKRMGFGFKTAYNFDFARIGLILFSASDDVSSLTQPIPIEAGVSPMDNAVLSLESEFKLFKKADLRIEYAQSGVTEDKNVLEEKSSPGLLSFLLDENITTNYYNALKVDLTYPAFNGTLGVGYERVDPNYKTLGAYYFNNDLENITVSATQTLLENKLNVSVNAGIQQDNLDKSKSSELQRIVSSFTLNYTPSDRLAMNGSYSNFQSYTNIRDQFDYINQVGDFDNIDTLNYRQISQNANLGINYILEKDKTPPHSTNLNLIYQNSINQQDGETVEGGKNDFYNATAAYTLGLPEKGLNVSLAANASFNNTAGQENWIYGPTLSVGKQFLEKKLRTRFSASYNQGKLNGETQNSTFNTRIGANYMLEGNHNLSLNALSLFRNTQLRSDNDFTLTLGYTYTFDNIKLKKSAKTQKDKASPEQLLSFRYREVTYRGTKPLIYSQLNSVFGSSKFESIPQDGKIELQQELGGIKEIDDNAEFKEASLGFLEKLYGYIDFKDVFNEGIYVTVNKIKRDMRKIDLRLERAFVSTTQKLKEHRLYGADEFTKSNAALAERKAFSELESERQNRMQKLVGHRWMEEQFSSLVSRKDITSGKGYLEEFKRIHFKRTMETYKSENNIDDLKKKLEIDLIDFYFKKSVQVEDADSFELKYIDKNR
jgi:hypothetical protein